MKRHYVNGNSEERFSYSSSLIWVIVIKS